MAAEIVSLETTASQGAIGKMLETLRQAKRSVMDDTHTPHSEIIACTRNVLRSYYGAQNDSHIFILFGNQLPNYTGHPLHRAF